MPLSKTAGRAELNVTKIDGGCSQKKKEDMLWAGLCWRSNHIITIMPPGQKPNQSLSDKPNLPSFFSI